VTAPAGSPLRRISVTVPADRAEEARTAMLWLFPGGFEESVPRGTGAWLDKSAWADDGASPDAPSPAAAEAGPADTIDFAAYTDDPAAEAALRAAGLGPVAATDVEAGWEERWRAFHHGVAVGRLWVGPPWEAPDPAAGLLPLIVDPGRAFGTGAHPTTRLCLELLQGEAPGSVLDVGCGSGVLAVAAALLGHAPALGLDDDPLAVEATRENAEANGVAAAVEARLADARDPGPLPVADLALVNIGLRLVEAVLPRLQSRRAIVAGFLDRDTPAAPGWRRLERRSLDGWAAELLEREEAPSAAPAPGPERRS
jgi:ribosomal protein L11 methyltransferase